MVTRISWRRGAVPFVCVLLVAVGHRAAQPPTGVAPVTPTGPAVPTPPGGLAVPSIGPTVPQVPTPPPAPTIDQLMEKLEQLRKQKADLEKEEQAVTAQLRTALQKQKERLPKLGVEEPAQPRPGIPHPVPPQPAGRGPPPRPREKPRRRWRAGGAGPPAARQPAEEARQEPRPPKEGITRRFALPKTAHGFTSGPSTFSNSSAWRTNPRSVGCEPSTVPSPSSPINWSPGR